MNIYVRRVDNQAINKQISILREVVHNFFGDNSSIQMTGKTSKFEGNVSILLATDPRLGGDIKQIINKEGGMNEGDFLLFYKRRNKFVLEVLKTSDSRYSVLNDLFDITDKHLEIEIDEQKIDDILENSVIGINKIFYGIPGCGKSYKIQAMLEHKEGFIEEAKNNRILTRTSEDDIIRTTFYLDYSNSDFVGQIYPHVEKREVETESGIKFEEFVTYKKIAGPFTNALLRAYQHLIDNSNKQVYLIIEEINRGNAAAIFGDIFQLLDRKKNGDSEYPINNDFIESYLKEHLNGDLPNKYDLNKIIIPHNLTIFATMNTSDQNVFPLDTAFKRRWNREKVTNNWNKVGQIKEMYIPYTSVTWENFAKTINKEMVEKSANNDAPISEDKQMGAYFADTSMLTEEPNKHDKSKMMNFTNNVLDYLYNDVTKFDHRILFDDQLNTSDKVYDRVEFYMDKFHDNTNEVGAEQAESQNIFSEIFTKDISIELVGNAKKVDDDND